MILYRWLWNWGIVSAAKRIVLTTYDVYKAVPSYLRFSKRIATHLVDRPIADKPIGGKSKRDRPLT